VRTLERECNRKCVFVQTTRRIRVVLARFPLEIHLWTIPLLFATGWVIGYAHFRHTLARRHPDLYREWFKRNHPGEPIPDDEPLSDDEADEPAERRETVEEPRG